MDEDKIQLIESAIKNGLGFTHTCGLIRICPKEASKKIKESSELKKRIFAAADLNVRAMLSLTSSMVKEGNAEAWFASASEMKTKAIPLVLWEDFCTEKSITPEIATTTLLKCGGATMEAATGCGMELSPFLKYITENNLLAFSEFRPKF